VIALRVVFAFFPTGAALHAEYGFKTNVVIMTNKQRQMRLMAFFMLVEEALRIEKTFTQKIARFYYNNNVIREYHYCAAL